MASMQRPCAHMETDASLAAGQGRILTTTRTPLSRRRRGRAETNTQRILLNQPQLNRGQYKPIKVGTSE